MKALALHKDGSGTLEGGFRERIVEKYMFRWLRLHVWCLMEIGRLRRGFKKSCSLCRGEKFTFLECMAKQGTCKICDGAST